jgi:hypothetical protein
MICLLTFASIRFLNQAALTQSQHQFSTGVMSHDGPGGNSLGDRIREAGVSPRNFAENVAHGQPDVQTVMDAWMHSQGHHNNIMNPDFSLIGVSKVGDFWTQVFAGGGEGGEEDGGEDGALPSCGHVSSGSLAPSPDSNPAPIEPT